jgi:HEPN domain-containing protein
MNRNELKELARIRLKEAGVLLKNGNYEGAYYLCGYVVECGLKACVAKQTRRYDFPNKKTVDESYTHDLTKLVKTAGLELDLEREMKLNPNFGVNWGIVKDWSETSRYEKHTEKEAHALYSAVATRKYGVLQWIQRYW